MGDMGFAEILICTIGGILFPPYRPPPECVSIYNVYWVVILGSLATSFFLIVWECVINPKQDQMSQQDKDLSWLDPFYSQLRIEFGRVTDSSQKATIKHAMSIIHQHHLCEMIPEEQLQQLRQLQQQYNTIVLDD